MVPRSKVLGDRPIHREQSLRVPQGFQPLHASFPLPRWLVRVLGAVVEVPMLAVLYPRHDLPLRSAVALQFIRDDHDPTGQRAPSHAPV
jgi:hypothetical protein